MHSLTPCSFCAAIITSTLYWCFKYPNSKIEALKRGLYPLHMGAGGFAQGGLCTRTEVQKAHPYWWGLSPTQAAHPMRGVACVSGLCTTPQGQPIHMTGGSPIRVTESPSHDRAALPYGRGVTGGWPWRGPRVAWPLRVRGLPCSCDCGPFPVWGGSPYHTAGRLYPVHEGGSPVCL